MARTDTPQEYFAHVGNLESKKAIAHIAEKMITHEQSSLRQACVGILNFAEQLRYYLKRAVGWPKR